ncbi:uncharacterized protein LOC143229398 [Tachypleus tridentatus]|uniref:uncharacterized protein LOC143229398 n=1 Tax=Tachypleus tridentatus TaxID=6853 RepID=UPI003FD0E055
MTNMYPKKVKIISIKIISLLLIMSENLLDLQMHNVLCSMIFYNPINIKRAEKVLENQFPGLEIKQMAISPDYFSRHAVPETKSFTVSDQGHNEVPDRYLYNMRQSGDSSVLVFGDDSTYRQNINKVFELANPNAVLSTKHNLPLGSTMSRDSSRGLENADIHFHSTMLAPSVAISGFSNDASLNKNYLQGGISSFRRKTDLANVLNARSSTQDLDTDFQSDSNLSQLYANPYAFRNPHVFHLFSEYGHQAQERNLEYLSSQFPFMLDDFGLEDLSNPEFITEEDDYGHTNSNSEHKEDKDKNLMHEKIERDHNTETDDTSLPDFYDKDPNVEDKPSATLSPSMMPSTKIVEKK